MKVEAEIRTSNTIRKNIQIEDLEHGTIMPYEDSEIRDSIEIDIGAEGSRDAIKLTGDCMVIFPSSY